MEPGYVRKFSQRAKCDLRSCKKCIPREFPELSLLLIYICHTSCYSIIVILLLYTRLYLYSMHIHINIHHHQMHFVPVCFFFSSCCVRLLLSLSISHTKKEGYIFHKNRTLFLFASFSSCCVRLLLSLSLNITQQRRKT